MTDDELNAAITVEVMGWQGAVAWGVMPGGRVRTGWSPATNIADAFEVVEQMREPDMHWDALIVGEAGLQWRVTFEEVDGRRREIAFASDLPRAICEAALAAVRGEE